MNTRYRIVPVVWYDTQQWCLQHRVYGLFWCDLPFSCNYPSLEKAREMLDHLKTDPVYL